MTSIASRLVTCQDYDHAVESELVGAAEIAALLGVSRQRVDQLSRHQDFPEPLTELASGRIWTRQSIEEWARASGREIEK